MKREIDINEITDGREYTSNDMVKVGCHDCEGCHACCQGMGNSIVLDPYDVFRLVSGTGKSVNELLETNIELNVVDDIILPNLKLSGDNEQCSFLNDEGRCSIHKYRPGICRMFPLGRMYTDDGFRYILQVHECQKPEKTKVKVHKWLDTPNLGQYEKYIMDWHDFLTGLRKIIGESDEQTSNNISVVVMKYFYLSPYDYNGSFYDQFSERLLCIKSNMGW